MVKISERYAQSSKPNQGGHYEKQFAEYRWHSR